MVRKRSYKKYVKEESEESDSDDFYDEETSEINQPKKYSLRQRRGANFAEDFDYDLVEDGDNKLADTNEVLRSDDEDFDLKETEEEEGATNSEPQVSRAYSRPKKYQKEGNSGIPNCTITKYKDRELEPEIPKDRQSSEDMIDFEDVIRADILVNKSRIDYDSIIEKTEIKVEKIQPEEDKGKDEKVAKSKSKITPVKYNKNGEPTKKRGRKSKKQKVDEECYENESFIEESDNAGLPINTVLGVTESLYELAERYHMQGGAFVEEIASLPIEPLVKENISTESTESGFVENDCTIPLPEPEAVSGAIESF